MFHKALSMLLCACMLTGSVPTTAYAMESTVVEQSESIEEVSTSEEDETDLVTDTEVEVVSEEEAITEETASEESEEEATTEETVSEESEEEAITEEIVSEESEEEAITEETVSEESEEEAIIEEIDEVVSEETIMENGVEKVEKVGYEAAEEMLEAQAAEEYTLELDTPLEVNDISNIPVKVLFTAPSAGIYAFDIENKGEGYYLEINIGDGTQEEMESMEYFDVRNGSTERTYVSAKAGAVIGVSAHSFYSNSTVDMEITVSKIEVAEGTLIQGENEAYTATANGMAMSVNVEKHCQVANISVKLDSATEEALSDSQYYVWARVVQENGNSIGTKEYQYNLYSFNDYEGKWQKTGLDTGKTYSIQFIVMDYDSNVVAVFSGAEFTTKTAEEKVSLGVEEVRYTNAEVWWEEVVKEGTEPVTYKLAYAVSV